MERKEGQVREEYCSPSDIVIPLTIEIPLAERFIVPESDVIQSFAQMSVSRPELCQIFCPIDRMIYPLRFSFITPILEDLPFLFLVQFLLRLIGICQFPWFQPGNILYSMVNHPSNSENQSSFSLPYCRLVFLIRLVLYQYGYVADIPLSQLLRGQDPEDRRQNPYTEQGTPYFRMVTEKHMQAYFGW